MNQHPFLEPKAILKQREVIKGGKNFSEVLVQWNHHSIEDATWEDAAAFRHTFPHIILEDKDQIQPGAIDAQEVAAQEPSGEAEARLLRRSARTKHGKPNLKFKDYILN